MANYRVRGRDNRSLGQNLTGGLASPQPPTSSRGLHNSQYSTQYSQAMRDALKSVESGGTFQ